MTSQQVTGHQSGDGESYATTSEKDRVITAISASSAGPGVTTSIEEPMELSLGRSSTNQSVTVR